MNTSHARLHPATLEPHGLFVIKHAAFVCVCPQLTTACATTRPAPCPVHHAAPCPVRYAPALPPTAAQAFMNSAGGDFYHRPTANLCRRRRRCRRVRATRTSPLRLAATHAHARVPALNARPVLSPCHCPSLSRACERPTSRRERRRCSRVRVVDPRRFNPNLRNLLCLRTKGTWLASMFAARVVVRPCSAARRTSPRCCHQGGGRRVGERAR